jgi:hypothetical protein
LTTVAGATLTIRAPEADRWDITWIEPQSGAVLSESSTAPHGTVTLDIPTFAGEIAVRIDALIRR